MKFLMFIKNLEPERKQVPPQALMDAMGPFVGEAIAKGIVKETGGLMPAAQSQYIRSKGGRLTFKDGPFAESKELVGGFALVETKTREEALELAKAFMELHRVHWPEFECESEVRQIEGF